MHPPPWPGREAHALPRLRRCSARTGRRRLRGPRDRPQRPERARLARADPKPSVRRRGGAPGGGPAEEEPGGRGAGHPGAADAEGRGVVRRPPALAPPPLRARAARRAAARRACAGLHACSPELHGASAFQAARWPCVLGKAALGKDCCCALPAPGVRGASTLPRAPQRVSKRGRAQEHGGPRCMRRLRGAGRCATARARPRRRKVKQTMYRMWAKVYEANYHKSLDHRSFYFKQARPGRGCGAGSLTGLLSAPRRVSGCTEIAGAARQWKGPHWGLFSCKGLSLLRAFPAACLAECTSPHGLRCSPAAPAH